MDLKIWQISMDLVEDVYKITSNFPKEEMYALSSQMKRSAISIPSNIAEGASRQTTKEFIKFLYISLGSLSELETQLLIANRLNYAFDVEKVLFKIKGLKKMIINMIQSLKN
jgi:four helix bundle protein